MEKQLIYTYKDKDYPVLITYKRMKNIVYRYKEGTFYINCPIHVRDKKILDGLNKFAPKLISRDISSALKDDYFYIFGNKYITKEKGTMTLTDGSIISYSSKQDLYNKLKPIFLNYVTSRVKYYSSSMNLSLYKVKARDMTTRFGSNSKHTNTLYFAYQLMHYSVEIIDSVVVNEIAHIKVFDHYKKFYDVVLQYCPEYKKYRKKLINRIYR